MSRSIESRLDRIEHRLGATDSGAAFVFVLWQGYELPETCAQGLVLEAMTKQPGETFYAIWAHNNDGTCAYCGREHPERGHDEAT